MKREQNRANASMHLEPLEGRQMMAAGDLDLTFGNGGKVIAAETVGHPVADVAVQSDGKLVVVGSLNNDFAVTRFNANGTLDRTFGGGGFVRSDFGGSGGDFARAVVVQPNGKIVVVGSRGENGARDDTVFAVARYNPNGTPDNTFDGNGLATYDLGKPSSANAVALQPDGKILVAGEVDSGRVNINDNFGVARLNPDGSLDRTFGQVLPNLTGQSVLRTGKVTIDFHADVQGEAATLIAVAPDGKIVVGGLGGNDQEFGPLRLAVARLTTNGTIDKSFGDGISGDGKFNNLLLTANWRDLNVAADGSVTVVGGRNGNFLTVRLTSKGRLDPTFGGRGRVETDLGGNDDAKHVFVNREGILVAGGSSGKFAMARFRLNGQLDTTFGQGGKVITKVGENDAILTTKSTSDGKLLAYGRSGSSARYITAAPTVNVFSLDPDGAEGGNNPASLIFTRDLRLSFPTRVFYSLGGTASLDADYNGPTVLKPANTRGAPGLVPVGSVFGDSVGFIDIPAGETTAIVPINVVDDRVLESAETVRASLRANAAYALGNRTTQQVDIADNDIVRVNFQVTPSPFAFAYEPDLGLAFGARNNGLRFGWDVDNQANARDRGLAAPGLIYNTYNHMQKSGGGSKWEIAVPNGMYEVKLAAGDPQQIDSVYRMNLENTPALSGTPGGDVRWFERTVRIEVKDGRLTLSNGAGAVNNKIAFIEIRSAAPGAVAGPLSPDTPVRLPA